MVIFGVFAVELFEHPLDRPETAIEAQTIMAHFNFIGWNDAIQNSATAGLRCQPETAMGLYFSESPILPRFLLHIPGKAYAPQTSDAMANKMANKTW